MSEQETCEKPAGCYVLRLERFDTEGQRIGEGEEFVRFLYGDETLGVLMQDLRDAVPFLVNHCDD